MFNDDLSSKETDKFVTPIITKDDIEIKIINKLEINERQKFNGLSKEEVLKYANDPKWVKIRWILFALFWLVWIGMLVIAILFIVLTPKCPYRPSLSWWQKDCFYQIDVTKFKDSNGDGVGDLNGVVSKLDYLNDLGFKSLFLNQMVNLSEVNQLDSRIGNTESLDSLRKELKERDMRFVLDVPFAFLRANNDFEKKSREFLNYWLNNYADGVRFLETNENNGFTFLNSDIDNSVYKWREQINEISKKTLKEKVLLFDSGSKTQNNNYTNANPTFSLNRHFTELNEKVLSNPSELKTFLNAYYSNLESLANSNLLFKTYDTKSLPVQATILQYLLRGTPISFYGDEIGLNKDVIKSGYMKWDNTASCGFTTNSTVANEVNANKSDCESSVNWLTAHGAGHTLLESIQELTQLHKHPSFLWGKQEFMDVNKTDVFSFVRKADGFDGYLVAIHLNQLSKEREFVNFHERHGVDGKAVVKYYFSFSGNFNSEFKLNAELSVNRILLRYGDVLILKYSN